MEVCLQMRAWNAVSWPLDRHSKGRCRSCQSQHWAPGILTCNFNWKAFLKFLQVEVLSVLSTPANTPSIETGGFNFNGQSSANRGRKRSGLTPCSEQTKFQFGTFKSQNEDADRLREEEKVAFKFSKDKMKIPAAKLVGPHSEGSAKCEEKSGWMRRQLR